MWKVVHQNNCEQGFYDQDGEGPLTIPIGTQVTWLQGEGEGCNPRPEMDFKDVQMHPEVYEGRYSASGSYRHAYGKYWLVTDRIYVDPANLVRGSCRYMHVFDGGGGGARCGIVNGDGPWAEKGGRWEDPTQGDVETQWGQWRGTYGEEGVPNREWVKLSTPALQPLQGFIRLVMQFNADYAGPSSAGHWDVMMVEQEDGGGIIPPPNGDVDYDRIEQIMADVIRRTYLVVEGG